MTAEKQSPPKSSGSNKNDFLFLTVLWVALLVQPEPAHVAAFNCMAGWPGRSSMVSLTFLAVGVGCRQRHRALLHMRSLSLCQASFHGWSGQCPKRQRQKLQSLLNSQFQNSRNITSVTFYLLVKAGHKASPQLRGGEIYSTFRWEQLQNTVAMFFQSAIGSQFLSLFTGRVDYLKVQLRWFQQITFPPSFYISVFLNLK